MDAAEGGRAAARRDAVRNEQRVLAAARVVLGRVGPQATIEEIAAEAGVGVGTVYRRLGNKDALIDAVVGHMAADIASAALAAASAPAGEGLERFLTEVGTIATEARRYAELWLDRSPDPATRRATHAAIATLVERAIAHRVIRPDIDVVDVLLVGRALCTVIHHTTDDVHWRRFLSDHLRGLRPLDD